MQDTKVTSVDIQNDYKKLYEFLMDFLWEYPTIEALANLEVACYHMFPDKEEMQKYLKELNYKIQSTYNELTEDNKDEFQKAYDKLEKSIDDYIPDDAIAELYSVSEPVELPVDSVDDKEVFKIGDIQHRHLDENDVDEENDEVIEEVEEDRLANPFEEE